MADGVIAGLPASTDLAAVPFVGAALQVYFTALASRLSASRIERSEGGCPVCDSAPVAGVVLGDDKLRYLCCSLCGAEWNLTRIQCWSCRDTGGIRYLGVAGDGGAIKAEACAPCGSYLKIFYLEKMPLAEPLADDVASLTLDLLAAQEEWARNGVNLFLLGGAEV
jgi:FdhE protein